MEDARGLCALLGTVVVLMLVPAATAHAGSSGCGDIGRAHSVQTLSPATCADAQALVPSYYSNGSCFASGAPQQRCSTPARNVSWTCSFVEGQVNCQSEASSGNTVGGVIKWRDGPDTTPLRLTALALTPATFRAASSGGPFLVPGRTRIMYRLTKPATVTFAVFRLAPGRKVGPGPSGCRPQTPRNRTRPRCTITKSMGSFSHQGSAGNNAFGFSGRMAANRKLLPGTYRLRATPAGLRAGLSRTFRIVP